MGLAAAPPTLAPFTTNNPVLGTGVAIPALQGDLLDIWRTGTSKGGMICVEVLPDAVTVLAQEAAAILATGESFMHW